MTTLEGTTQEFRIGSVLGRAFSILSKNLVPFGLLSVAVMSPTHTFAVAIDPQYFSNAANPWDQTEFSLIGAGISIVESLLGFILTAALVFGTFQELRGRHASLGDCLKRGVALILPVIGIAILVGLSVGFATLLFVIPGFIVLTMLWVAIPVAVLERPGVVASLSRSMELTKGYRWRIFGLIIILYIMALIAGVGLALLLGVIAAGAGLGLLLGVIAAGFADSVLVWGGLILSLLISAFFTALSAVVSAVGYHDLRVIKEGIDVEQIAAVFD